MELLISGEAREFFETSVLDFLLDMGIMSSEEEEMLMDLNLMIKMGLLISIAIMWAAYLTNDFILVLISSIVYFFSSKYMIFVIDAYLIELENLEDDCFQLDIKAMNDYSHIKKEFFKKALRLFLRLLLMVNVVIKSGYSPILFIACLSEALLFSQAERK